MSTELARKENPVRVKTVKSSAFEWKPGEGETFTFVTASWDVSRAKELIRDKPRRVQSIALEQVKMLVERPDTSSGLLTMGVSIDWKKVDKDPTVDLDLPVIVAWVPESRSWLPIDGWHRIAKAVQKGLTHLPAVGLNQKESKSIRIR